MKIRKLNVIFGLLLMGYALYYLVLTAFDMRAIHESSAAWLEGSEEDKALFLTIGVLSLNTIIALGIAFMGLRFYKPHKSGVLVNVLGVSCLIMASGIIGKLLALGVIVIQYSGYRADKINKSAP